MLFRSERGRVSDFLRSRCSQRVSGKKFDAEDSEKAKGKTPPRENLEGIQQLLSHAGLKNFMLSVLEESAAIKDIKGMCLDMGKQINAIRSEVKEIGKKVDKLDKNAVNKQEIVEVSKNLKKIEAEKIKEVIAKVEKLSVPSYASTLAKTQASNQEKEWKTVENKAAMKNYNKKDPKKMKLLIKSNSEESKEKDSSEIYTTVTKKVSQKELNSMRCTVDITRKLKNAISVETTCEDKEKVLKTFTFNLKDEKLDITEIGRDMVTVKISSIPKEMSNDDLYDGIAEGIEGVTLEKVKDNLLILRRKMAKQWGRQIVFARARGELADMIIKKKEIYLGYSGRVQVVPSICIMSCGRCGDLSHSQRFCEKEKVCFSCGSKEHTQMACKEKEKICIACKNHNKPNKHRYMTSVCPLYRIAVEKQLAREGSGLGDLSIEEFIAQNTDDE